jgi:uncharacterized membrane protein HdeD (DUF308 family)
MQLAIRDYRRMLLFRGIIAVLLGILILVWPRIALAVLVYLFGALVLVGGIIAVATALRYSHEQGWALLLVEGILGILAGVVAFAWPGITLLFFVFLIAAWAIVTGILEIVSAFMVPLGAGREWLLGLTGLVSIIFGILIAIRPIAGLFAIVWLIGIYAIVLGILFIVRYFQSRSLAVPA